MEFFQFHQSEIRIVAYCLFVCLLFSSKHSFAGEPDFAPNTRPKNIVFNIGVGYGVSNNPCRDCDNSQSVNGVVIAGSLGYKINKKFKVDFGPSIWIEGNDIFNNSGNGARKPSNKRMLIAFSGYYSPFKNFPLSIKLGGGVGSLTYTEDRNRVQIDSKSVNDTEFMSGLAGTFAVLYTVNLGPSLKIHPSAGFWYTDITTPVPSFDSHTDPAKPSITGDIRVNFQFYF